MQKGDRQASNLWPSLLVGQFAANPLDLDNTQKKLTLERFQREVRPTVKCNNVVNSSLSPKKNPGFDFSGAEITGNYQGGGPQLPST
jgi:hypothetical protein